LHGKNAVEVILSEKLSRKHPVFPVSLIKHYNQRSKEEQHSVPDIPLQESIPTSKQAVARILKDKKERINGKDTRLYLVRYKNATADLDEWLPESNIPDGPIHLRNYRATKRRD
jgi:hypothetical protein